MSGLTLGLLSLNPVDLNVLIRSGSPPERRNAARILPVIENRHHVLLVTLLLCNAVAMEALPVCLNEVCSEFVAVIISVTVVLLVGEVIPQAICAKYSLSIGGNLMWLVHFLIIICYPVAYPIGKVLDCLLGHSNAMIGRAQFKALISIHKEEVGRGSELTEDETTVIGGALDLSEKTAEQVMTPIDSVFSLEANSILDKKAMLNIFTKGHSRVPVYLGNRTNIIGLILVKSLINLEGEITARAAFMKPITRVQGDTPLYVMLHAFSKERNHMAVVVKTRNERILTQQITSPDSQLTLGLLQQPDEPIGSVPEEVIGIITLEDVLEQLIKADIVDETDEYVNVYKKIRVSAAAAYASIGREVEVSIGDT